MRASKSSASSTHGAPGSSMAPWTAHSPPDSPPAQPVIGTPRGSRGQLAGQRVEPLLEPLDHRRVGALLRPEHLRARPRTACARRTARRACAPPRPPASSIASSAPAPPSVVAEPPTATMITAAPACGRRGDQLAGAVGRSRPRVALAPRRPAPARSPSRSRRSRVPPSSTSAEAAGELAPERIVGVGGDDLAAEAGQQRVERPLAAVGDRAQVGRHQAGALEPAADRARHLGGPERALERVGRDQDRALGRRRHP